MNYFNHHIGDYRRDTAHLTLLEHGVYRQLLDLYYLSESPIPLETDWVLRRLSAKTQEEAAAVHSVLADFFVRSADGFRHKRCDLELREYAARAEVARANGKRGGRPKKTQPVISGNPEETKHKTNHSPFPIPQEPVKGDGAGKPARSSRLITLSTYLDRCKSTGEKPIPEDHYIRGYFKDAGIDADMAALAWMRFREEHTTGSSKDKKYLDWPAAFANSVKGRWYRLWIASADGPATWTSEGLQAKRVIEARKQESEHEPA